MLGKREQNKNIRDKDQSNIIIIQKKGRKGARVCPDSSEIHKPTQHPR